MVKIHHFVNIENGEASGVYNLIAWDFTIGNFMTFVVNCCSYAQVRYVE